MNADGSGQTRLTTRPDFEIEPRWSPDGQRLVFARHPLGGAPELWLMQADGSALRRLTAGADADWRS
jgi:Tol biopolymer transport system component